VVHDLSDRSAATWLLRIEPPFNSNTSHNVSFKGPNRDFLPGHAALIAQEEAVA